MVKYKSQLLSWCKDKLFICYNCHLFQLFLVFLHPNFKQRHKNHGKRIKRIDEKSR